MSRRRKDNVGDVQPAAQEALVPYSRTGLPSSIADARLRETPVTDLREQELRKAQDRELHMAWVQLRGSWKWLVMIPANPADSTDTIARALCEVGARLSLYPIEFIEATNVDLDNSSMLISRLGTSAGSGWTPAAEQQPPSATWAAPIIKTIVALESPLANPLALPLALAADGVILCIRRGYDRIGVVRQAIEAVGASRIVCCLLID